MPHFGPKPEESAEPGKPGKPGKPAEPGNSSLVEAAKMGLAEAEKVGLAEAAKVGLLSEAATGKLECACSGDERCCIATRRGDPAYITNVVILLTFLRNYMTKQQDTTEKTRYDATTVPACSMCCYLHRMIEYLSKSEREHSNFHPDCFLMAGLYIFQLMGKIGGITPLNVHRVVAGAMSCAIKYDTDAPHKFKHYADVCGMPFDKQVVSNNGVLRHDLKKITINPRRVRHYGKSQLDENEEEILDTLSHFQLHEMETIESATLDYLNWNLHVMPQDMADFAAGRWEVWQWTRQRSASRKRPRENPPVVRAALKELLFNSNRDPRVARLKAEWDKEAQRCFFDVSDEEPKRFLTVSEWEQLPGDLPNRPSEIMPNWDEAAAEKAIERGYIGTFRGREINRNFNQL